MAQAVVLLNFFYVLTFKITPEAFPWKTITRRPWKTEKCIGRGGTGECFGAFDSRAQTATASHEGSTRTWVIKTRRQTAEKQADLVYSASARRVISFVVSVYIYYSTGWTFRQQPLFVITSFSLISGSGKSQWRNISNAGGEDKIWNFFQICRNFPKFNEKLGYNYRMINIMVSMISKK